MKRFDNDTARKHGISKHMRQYAKRYGSHIDLLVAEHRKHKQVRMLDHGAEKAEAFRKYVADAQKWAQA